MSLKEVRHLLLPSAWGREYDIRFGIPAGMTDEEAAEKASECLAYTKTHNPDYWDTETITSALLAIGFIQIHLIMGPIWDHETPDTH